MIKINTPFVFQANDYHEFDNLQCNLKDLSGAKLKYMELDSEEYGVYFAVFYTGKRPNKNTIDRLYKNL